ncbi:MAG: hypothetical protein GX556_15555 [Fibrobacter sp.]|nr:hypothetical protein [Fibrobacter sp.]
MRLPLTSKGKVTNYLKHRKRRKINYFQVAGFEVPINGWFSSARRHIPPVTCKSYSGFQFSPAGSWLVFKDETNDMLKPVFIALPVIKDSHFFPGEPLYPGRLMTKDAPPA